MSTNGGIAIGAAAIAIPLIPAALAVAAIGGAAWLLVKATQAGVEKIQKNIALSDIEKQRRELADKLYNNYVYSDEDQSLDSEPEAMHIKPSKSTAPLCQPKDIESHSHLKPGTLEQQFLATTLQPTPSSPVVTRMARGFLQRLPQYRSTFFLAQCDKLDQELEEGEIEGAEAKKMAESLNIHIENAITLWQEDQFGNPELSNALARIHADLDTVLDGNALLSLSGGEYLRDQRVCLIDELVELETASTATPEERLKRADTLQGKVDSLIEKMLDSLYQKGADVIAEQIKKVLANRDYQFQDSKAKEGHIVIDGVKKDNSYCHFDIDRNNINYDLSGFQDTKCLDELEAIFHDLEEQGVFLKPIRSPLMGSFSKVNEAVRDTLNDITPEGYSVENERDEFGVGTNHTVIRTSE